MTIDSVPHDLTAEAARYTYRLEPDASGGFSASILELPGCFAEGETADQTVDSLQRAAAAWIQAARESGHPVPQPTDVGDYSGKIALRIPRSLHSLAAERAALENTSLNQLLVAAIAHYLGQRDGLAQSVRQFDAAVRLLGEFRFTGTRSTAETITYGSASSTVLNAIYGVSTTSPATSGYGAPLRLVNPGDFQHA